LHKILLLRVKAGNNKMFGEMSIFGGVLAVNARFAGAPFYTSSAMVVTHIALIRELLEKTLVQTREPCY